MDYLSIMNSPNAKASVDTTRLRKAIEKLEQRLAAGKKDRWDKAAVVAQFLSGTVIVIVGFLLNSALEKGQQADTERKQFTEYFKSIVAESDPAKRASLIAALDVAVGTDAQVIRVALSYATKDTSELVREQAIRLLGNYPEGKPMLQQIASGSQYPDKHLAAAVLGIKEKELLARLSDIDDDGYLFVNGTKIAEAHTSGTPKVIDTQWVDATKYLVTGKNLLEFKLHNGNLGGWSGRLQISAGGLQYDSTTLAKNACPCDADVLSIPVLITVGNDRTIEQVQAQPIVYF
jgi:hypothetical protein